MNPQERMAALDAQAGHSGRILYMTDKYGVSSGYRYAFNRMLKAAGVDPARVITADIYGLVDKPVAKHSARDAVWRFNPERKVELLRAFQNRLEVIKPRIVVISDPSLLGIITDWNGPRSTLDKLRGGVHWLATAYGEIPCIVTYPITAIHRNIDSTAIRNDDDEEDTYAPYKVLKGAWILQRDWEKVGRYVQNRIRTNAAFQYSIIRSVEDALEAERFLADCVLIGTDVETGLFPAQITCDGYTGLHRSGRVHSFVFPWVDYYRPGNNYWADVSDHIEVWKIKTRINANPVPKVMHNGPYDSSYSIKYRCPYTAYLYDTMLMWNSIYIELPKSLDFVSSMLLDDYQYWKDDIKGIENEKAGTGRRDPDMESYWRYNAMDCYSTLMNAKYLFAILMANPDSMFVYQDRFQCALSGLAISMRGVKADFKRRKEHERDLEADRAMAYARLRYMLQDPEFNVNSPPQKKSLLYDFMGLGYMNAKGRPVKTDKGASAGAIPLKIAKQTHPLFAIIIDALQDTQTPDKQISNVCHMKLFTDRFRQTLSAAGTKTFRFSSKSSSFWDGSNAQNIRDKYRDWLVADEGDLLLDVDYSQSDDVFISYESNDPGKIQLVESGLDGHAVHGELFFKRSYEWIVDGKKRGDPEVVHPITGVRQMSKKIVHGTNFQMAGFTLYIQMGRESVVAAARLLGYPHPERMAQAELVKVCDNLMLTYRQRYPRLTHREWYAELARDLAENGVLVNAFGMTREFLGDPKDNGTQREATAFMGQSGTASNMNRAMKEIDHGTIPERFRDGLNPDAMKRPLRMSFESHGIRTLLQTHDSFTFGLRLNHPRWKEAAHNVLTVMARPVIINGHTVRVRTEAGIGKRWGKGMTEWNGDVSTLDSVVSTAKLAK